MFTRADATPASPGATPSVTTLMTEARDVPESETQPKVLHADHERGQVGAASIAIEDDMQQQQ